MCSIKKVVPRNLAKFTGKHLRQSLMLYYIDKSWYHLIKECLQSFSKFTFKKLLAQSGDQTDIFWKFYSPTVTLWSAKTSSECWVTPLPVIQIIPFSSLYTGLRKGDSFLYPNANLHFKKHVDCMCWCTGCQCHRY